MEVKRKKKKKNKRLTRILYVLVTIFICLFIVEFLLLKYTRIFAGDDSKLDGVWITQIETTEIIASEMALWLHDVQGAEINSEELRSKLETCDVDCILSFDKKEHTYQLSVSEEDYALCSKQAYECLADILEGLVADRINDSGIDMDKVGMSLDELIVQTVGSTTEEYLESLGPKLMPDLEVLINKYNSRGSYLLKNGILIRGDESGSEITPWEYIIDGNRLVITQDANSIVYEKQVTN